MPSHAFQGSLRISLVSVPVKAYSATISGTSRISFNQLHANCHRRIQYKKFCPVHGQVTQDEIVSGYEYDKDQYVVFEPNEIERLRTEKDHSLDIAQFVPQTAIDPLAIAGKDYFLVPDGQPAQKAYQLIQASLAAAGVCGVAQAVISRREELLLIRPIDKLLVMTVLHYARELKSPHEFLDQLADVKSSKQEQDLTVQLIKALTVKKFDLAAFHDLYEERLQELIDAKVEGREVVAGKAEQEPPVINLMDAIRKSMTRIKPAEEPKARGKSRGGNSKPLTSVARRRKSG